jgi:hypothetical protein
MRFSGAVGYADSQEIAPGIWRDVITEKTYLGDVIRNARRLEPPPLTANDDIAFENNFSIVADAYAYENFANMRYVVWNGSKWRVTNVEVRRPRLILTVGKVWNGDTA